MSAAQARSSQAHRRARGDGDPDGAAVRLRHRPGDRPDGFFVTSVNPGNGADLGGLAGADAHCQKLAAAAGAGTRNWRAYLSTGFTTATPAVHTSDAEVYVRDHSTAPRASTTQTCVACCDTSRPA